jgi:hypothetical protein
MARLLTGCAAISGLMSSVSDGCQPVAPTPSLTADASHSNSRAMQMSQ